MALLVPIASTTALVLAVLYIRLAFAVIKKRRQHKVALGTGQQPDLEAAIRAHGNFAEYVPLALVLLACAELNHAPWWLLLSSALALVIGRTIHASAISGSDLKKRVQGMKLTFASLALGVTANVVPLALGLLNLTRN